MAMVADAAGRRAWPTQRPNRMDRDGGPWADARSFESELARTHERQGVPSAARSEARAYNKDPATPPRAESDGPDTHEVVLDLTQMTLDVTGIIDPTPFSDGANAAISVGRGDWSGAVISFVSAAVPYAGDAAKAGKLPRFAETLGEIPGLIRNSPRAVEALRAPLEALQEVLDRAPLGKLPEAVREPLQAMVEKLDEALGAVRSPGASPPQPAAPATASVGANGGTRPAGAPAGADAAASAKGAPPPTATGGAGGPGGTGGGSRPTAGGPDEGGRPDRPGGPNGVPRPRVTVNEARRVHILDGNGQPGAYSGGHAYGTGIPGKQEFPEGWDDDKIIDEIESVANDKAFTWDDESDYPNFRVEGTRDGVDIRVIVAPSREDVVTGHPTNLEPNPPEGRGQSQRGRGRRRR